MEIKERMTFSDLKFVRLTQPNQFGLIPRYLFEQVKGFDFNIDRLYQFGPILLASPLTFLYILADKKQLEKGSAIPKGILWAEVNPFNEDINAHTFSIDRKYQGNGAIAGVIEKLKEIIRTEKLVGKIIGFTIHPKVFERAGMKKSKKIIMEL